MKCEVTEVKPEADFWLYLRFRDGVTGRIRLNPTDMKGALEPLRDPKVFAQAYINNGLVSWPGDIDLAPEAMHSYITRENNLTVF